jgi:hypothetical protein
MDVHLDKFIGSFEQFGSKNDNTCGTITDFRVLQLCQLDKKVANRMFDLKFFKNSGALIISKEIPSLVMVTYPISSTIILSKPCGPSDDRTILATDMAALTRVMKECTIAVPDRSARFSVTLDTYA